MKAVIRLVAATLAAVAGLAGPAPAPSAPPAPFTPPDPPSKLAARAWEATADAARADVVVDVAGYPDLSPADRLHTKAEKTRFVAQTLMDFADQAQAALRRDLGARGVEFRVLWISNSLYVPNADRATLSWLGARPEVARVDLDVKARGIEKTTDNRQQAADGATSFVGQPALRVPKRPSLIEWGIARVHAPEVWAQGFTGQGIVVANLDTGVEWGHPALMTHYRGWDGAAASHDYNWLDPTGTTVAFPTDDNDHGTHTTGTAVGDDGADNQIGVAPGARWIACRNMKEGIGSVALYTACFQFALAPTDVDGNHPDPTRSADITSNSWTCLPWSEEGCEVATALVTATQALRHAGVMVVAAAGNYGGGCATVLYAPGTLDQSLTVGAVDSLDAIASFSSRGPSTLTGRIKPDLVAPGVAVRSGVRGGSYSYKQGTSMATPHVAGVAALLWSAAPWLRGQIDETEDLLRRTAQPLTGAETCAGVSGSAVPNNTFGYGLVDARAAVSEAFRLGVQDGRGVALAAVGPAAVSVHEPLTFSQVLTNQLPITLTGAMLTITLPTSATVIGVGAGGQVEQGRIIWAPGELAPHSGVSLTFTISVPVPGPVEIGGAALTYRGLTSTIYGPPFVALIYVYRLRFILIYR